MTTARRFAELGRTLSLEQCGPASFVGPVASHTLPRVFGGQVLAQAIVAAAHTVAAARRPHSLHAYFLAGGDPAEPIHYRVESLRDGRSLSARWVQAKQDRTPIFAMMASFTDTAAEHTGDLSHQYTRMPAVPEPGELPTLAERLGDDRGDLPSWWRDGQPFDLRFVSHPRALTEGSTSEPTQRFWFRAPPSRDAGSVPAAALLGYVSDLTLLDPALMPLGRSWYGHGFIQGASIDHSMWFHRPYRPDKWTLCEQVSSVSFAARTLCTATFFDVAGNLLASASQEGILREPLSRPAPVSSA